MRYKTLSLESSQKSPNCRVGWRLRQLTTDLRSVGDYMALEHPQNLAFAAAEVNDKIGSRLLGAGRSSLRACRWLFRHHTPVRVLAHKWLFAAERNERINPCSAACRSVRGCGSYEEE